jgi:cellulose biosynthesis protein BcsQ
MGKKNTIVLSFVASKGGPGKSTLCTVLMNYLHQNTDLEIVLLETDFIQATISKLRERELKNAQGMMEKLNALEPDEGLTDEELKDFEQQVAEEKKKYNFTEDDLYEIYKVAPSDVATVVKNDLMGEVDIVFVDVPGSLAIDKIITAYEVVDYIFIPTKYGYAEMDAFDDIVNVCFNQIKPYRKQFGKGVEIYGVLNKVSVNFTDYKVYRDNKDKMRIPFLKTDIPYSEVAFVRGFSSYKEYKYPSKPNLIRDFCEEIIEIITK